MDTTADASDLRGGILSKEKNREIIHEAFAQYLRDLREFAAKEKTEHTDRGALEKLLKTFAGLAHGKTKVQHEPKREADKGAPDFKVIKDAMILGYVENKAIGENLGKVLKSDQIAKYKTLSPNLVLTDYLEFIWITKDAPLKREQLCHDTDLENRKFKLNPERIDAVAALLTGFFSTAPEGIGTSKPLAEALAARSRLLRDFLGEELVRQEREHQEGRLFGLFKTFRDQVFHELTLKEFADAFAQMLAYGLFLARLNADEKTEITLSKGHALKAKERLQVFLTNTLEPIEPQPNFLLPAITEEAKEAQTIKRMPILVITGNPPYSGESKNKGKWISAAIDGYKYTVEKDAEGREFQKPLGERNPKWLNDDYVKFIRFAQLKMDEVDEGVVGIITNHSWLDNPTFRGMRQSLMRSFEQVYVLDLHGNAKKKERAPDGSKDENVFDIEQGVAISIFVKKKGVERGVWRGDIWGKRLEKYKTTSDGSLTTTNLHAVTPNEPYYLYEAQDEDKRALYEQGIALPEIMPLNSVGFVTSRDKLAIGFTAKEISARIADFLSRDVENARTHYKLGEDVRDWKVSWAQEDIKKGGAVIPVLYRPFDERYTFYTGRSRGFHVYPREAVSRQLLKPNVALITSRLTKGEPFRHALVSDKPVEVISLSPITSNNGFVFPLRGDNDAENLSPAFRKFIDSKYSNHYSPEELFGYFYSILHAQTYRTFFADFLRIDFPRIPFPEKASDFESLSELGWELVQAHLLKEYPAASLAKLDGKGDETVEAVRYSEVEKAIWINKTQCFKPVPEDVWKFHIGGYQVLEKYLKSRKGRQLSLDEIRHVGAVADSLAFTITQMAKIDNAYKKAFPDRG